MSKDAPNLIDTGDIAFNFPPEDIVSDLKSSKVVSIVTRFVDRTNYSNTMSLPDAKVLKKVLNKEMDGLKKAPCVYCCCQTY